MPDVQDDGAVSGDCIEKAIGEGDERNYADTGPLLDRRGTVRKYRNDFLDFNKARGEPLADARPMELLILVDRSEVGKRAFRVTRSSCAAKSGVHGGDTVVARDAAGSQIGESGVDALKLLRRGAIDAATARENVARGFREFLLVFGRPGLDRGQ